MKTKIDLAAQTKIAKPRKKKVEVRPYTVGRGFERDLARLYIEIVALWAQGLNTRLMPEYHRSLEQALQTDSAIDLEVVIASIEQTVVAAMFTFRRKAQDWLSKVNINHLKQFVSQLKYATNVDLGTQMTQSDVTETLEDILTRNVALIRNVSDQARGRIADIVFRGLQNRTPARQVAKELNEAVQLGRARSLRIASDQSTKLAAALDKERQLQVGMDSFEWIHSGKKHPRLEHLARHGNIYAWNSEIGKNDPPGYAINCGCKAKGILVL